jgi:hypothetical protein
MVQQDIVATTWTKAECNCNFVAAFDLVAGLAVGGNGRCTVGDELP